MKILHLIANLDYHGAARQVTILASSQAGSGHEVQVVALAGEGPLAAPLRTGGPAFIPLHWRRSIDLGGPGRLRRVIKEFQPQVVHVWGLAALRSLGLVFGRFPWPVLISNALPAGKKVPVWNLLDRWLMGRTGLAVATQDFEAQRLIQAGLPRERIAVVPLAVPPWTDLRDQSSLWPGPSVVCVGPLVPHRGHTEALWALEILHFIEPDLHLYIVGQGPEGPRLQRFARTSPNQRLIHFLGARADLPSLLASAAVVWVPTLAPAGEGVALDAMALGKPVVASAWPDLTTIVEHERTGLLYTPGDKVGLARCTLRLLRDPALAHRLGEAGRLRALQQFNPGNMVRQMLDLYSAVAA